ncbi:MAG: ligase-associated DNA damage response endonuclease PdeM [Saprospiraceae bacterium]|nr:ligase-associated DNA damage response endonuclease PdeM [Saprospiraceae bacterium]
MNTNGETPIQDQTLEIRLRDTQLVLSPDRALFWPAYSTLVVTDLHLGKIQHFRNAGIYLPSHASLDNYERLSTLLLEFRPQKLLILGDLFHSSLNQDWINFCELRNAFRNVKFELVTGNHDIIDLDLYIKNDVTIFEEGVRLGPFFFSHHPSVKGELYNLAGHLHPGARLVGNGIPSISLPIFYFGVDGGILPSFGTFTGMSMIMPQPEDIVVAISEGQLFEIGG